MSTKEIKQNTAYTWKGLKKFYQVSVGVIEAFAWGGLLAVAYTIVFKQIEGSLNLNTALFTAVVFSTVIITLRLLVEGGKYFRELGKQS